MKYRQISLQNSEADALICALEFLSHCVDFSFADKPFNYNTPISVIDKLEADEIIYSYADLAAAIAAIELSLESISSHNSNFDQVFDDYEDLIPDLEASVPALEQLLPRLQSYLSDLS